MGDVKSDRACRRISADHHWLAVSWQPTTQLMNESELGFHSRQPPVADQTSRHPFDRLIGLGQS